MEKTQTQALEEAAALLKANRYVTGPETREERLHAVNQVLTELCYHLDDLNGISRTYLEAMRNSMRLKGIQDLMPASAEFLLTTAVQESIDQPCSSTRTG
ncbi:hypothetical protein ACT3TB_11115 [Micrococcaceae sp. AOP34-BR2-30]